MSKSIQRGYNKWTPHNLEVLKRKCHFFLEEEIKPQLDVLLQKVAKAIVDYIEQMTAIPQYTGNLHDATGVGVYVNGCLSAYVPTKIATKKQKSGFHNRTELDIDGNAYLTSALQDATADFSFGIWIVVFSAVPYAFYIQERPEQYFSEISDKLIQEILAGLAPYKKIPLWV